MLERGVEIKEKRCRGEVEMKRWKGEGRGGKDGEVWREVDMVGGEVEGSHGGQRDVES